MKPSGKSPLQPPMKAMPTQRTPLPTLSRRACLRGVGVGLALPFLEAMTPKRAHAAGEAPLRFLAVTAPHGMHMPAWTPKETGANYTLPPILAPLAALKSQVSVLSGLANYPASITTKEFAGSHARGTGAILTQTPLRFTAAKDIQNGISIDQMIANRVKSLTRLPSLEVGVAAGSTTGNCEDGYSCAYLHNVSWSGATTFLPKEVNPRALFNRVFAGLPAVTPQGVMTPPAAANKDLLHRKGILDLVRGEATRLSTRLGSRDRAKLDEYLTTVGELQRRVGDLEKAGGAPAPMVAACTPPAAPAEGTPSTYEAHLKLLADMLVMAFACDVTRVATFMQEDPFNSRSFSFLGVSGNHHNISHHGGSAEKHAAIQKINVFEVAQFAYLLDKMTKVQDANGQSLLHNSIVIFTSEFGDGDNHYHWDLPVLVAGAAGGRWKPGRHIAYPHKGTSGPGNKTDMPMANLFVSALQAFNIEATTFGSDGEAPYGTKPLAELAG
ncbi:MAG TPA: DUF1552 domain-containing protein [Polyangia bacterium]